MYKRLACCIFLLLIVPKVFAQDNWQRYSWGTPDREGFTVLLPTTPEQIAKANGEQGVSAFIDYVRFEATFRDDVSKEEFDRQIKAAMNIGGGGPGTGSTKAEVDAELNKNRVVENISICGYAGIEFGNSDSRQQFFLVKDRLYRVFVSGANRSNPSVEKFLKSFSLIKAWQIWKGMRTNENNEGHDGRSVPFEPDLCRNIDTAKTKTAGLALPRNSALRLISKPNAVYPEAAKQKQIQGTVSLKVMFLQDGTIGNISVVKGINNELNDSAVRAAKQIKFEPQRRNGKPVNVLRTLEYSFTLY
jgi:TonB family protein